MDTNSNSRKSKYELLYSIKLPDLYYFVTDVLKDFKYSLSRTVKEVEGKRRIEVWVNSSNSDEKGLVWIELLKPGDELDPYLTTDVLRAMNDEEVQRLFFFTNGNMNDEDRDILDGPNHFIFSTDEIVDTLTNIENKRSIKIVKKRKTVKTPSGMVLIKNFFKKREIRRKEIRLKTSATPELILQYTKLIRRILNLIDKVPDINDIPGDIKEKLKKIQYDLVPELVRTPSYVFPARFAELKNILFNIVQITIVYIGNFIEYESEEELKHNREIIEELLAKLDGVDDSVLSFKSDMMYQAEKNAIKIILTSGIITFIGLLLLIVVRFGR